MSVHALIMHVFEVCVGVGDVLAVFANRAG